LPPTGSELRKTLFRDGRLVDGPVTLSIQSPASELCWSNPVPDFEELRELAADVRIFIDLADDKAAALRDVIAAYDIVLAIYPAEDEMGLYVVKGGDILDKIAKSQTNAFYTHTAIAVPDVDHARKLKLLTQPQDVELAA
jgi:hypothetical protein